LFENWSGSQNEKWVLAEDGVQWYFITPDGGFWRWLGGDRDIAANSVLVATLSAGTYDDPRMRRAAGAGGKRVGDGATIDG
jgi:hypothetical protein